ncbi:MAG: LuxR C-terminal-related transcriptional regulator [Desulfobacteraceae bacterium]|jgi:LuxR family maltose regulon positive regulatory protein
MRFFEDLIRTKILIPLLKDGMLERIHLLNRLTEGKNCPLIVIQGMAGAGKTSLLCQWFKTVKLSTAWYSLDETDNEEDIFYRYLLAAFSEKQRHLVSKFSDWAVGGRMIEGQKVVNRLLRCLAEYKAVIYLVLDNFHCITSQKILEAFLYFLNHLPSNIHVVLSMRYNISLPLAAFKVKNQVMEITAEEMLFKEEEAQFFYSKVVPLNLTKEQISKVWRNTEGWVGGLHLFGLYQKGNQTPQEFETNLSKVCKETSSYLFNEVVDAQPENVKKFIEKTALLDRFNADISREITGLSDAAEIIDWIMKKNLFIICLDNKNKWFRYHHLFSMAIRDRMKTLYDVELAGIYKQAAMCFANRGYLEDAFRYAFLSGDIEFAADILEDYLIIIYERYDISAFIYWIAKIPHFIFIRRPLLRLMECRYHVEYNQLTEAESLIKDIENQKSELFNKYDSYRQRLCYESLFLIKFVSRFWADPFKFDVEELQEALDRISKHNKVFSGMARIFIAASYSYKGDAQKAIEAIHGATNIVMSSESLRVKVLWYHTMAFIERSQGRLHFAKRILDQGLSLLENFEDHDYDIRAAYILLHPSIGWVYYLRNELDNAMDHVSAAQKYIKEMGPTYGGIEVIGVSILAAFVHAARNETNMIDFYKNKIYMTARATGNQRLINLVDISIVLLNLHQGNIEEVERWAEGRRVLSDSNIFFYKRYEYLALGQLFCAKGRYEEALDLLENVRKYYEYRGLFQDILKVDLILCQALYALNRIDRATAMMENLLDLSESEGYIRPFLNQSKGVSPLLTYMLRRSPYLGERPKTAMILKGCEIELNTIIKKGNQNNDEYLTPKEVEVLKLLAIGYTYNEIGKKSFVSINTIRTHVKNIYSKLDVSTKTKAIRRAEALGLL